MRSAAILDGWAGAAVWRRLMSRVVLIATVLIPGAVVLAVGCGPHFSKPGATAADLARDSYECEHDPAYVHFKTLAATTPGYGPGIEARRLYKECMTMKGWQ